MKASACAVFALLVSCAASDESSPDPMCVDLARFGVSAVYSKSAKLLCVFEGRDPVFSTPASHGRVDGPKMIEGDGKTPEGRYALGPARKSKRFGYFLPISYPTRAQIETARKAGKSAGGSVGIHGPQAWYAFLGDWQALANHSDGCIVVSDAALKYLRNAISKTVAMEIVP